MSDALAACRLASLNQLCSVAASSNLFTHRDLVFMLFTVAVLFAMSILIRQIIQPIGVLVAALVALVHTVAAVIAAALATAAAVALVVAAIYSHA